MYTCTTIYIFLRYILFNHLTIHRPHESTAQTDKKLVNSGVLSGSRVPAPHHVEGPQRLPGEAVDHVVLETRGGGEGGAAVHGAHVRAVARPRPVPAMAVE